MATRNTKNSPAAAATRGSKRPALSADDLWAFERLGNPSLSPDGRQAVCALTRYSMADNKSASSLWLFATAGRSAAPRRLTACGDKDGQPACSPAGDRIAFVARREQQGEKDATAQLYVIAPDGGEAQRVSRFAPGIEAFKWMPDGKRIVFSAWVWPELKGAAAQAKRHKEFSERKESGYATSEAFYRHWDSNLPEGRVLHLLMLDLASGRVTDLFEGTALELPRGSDGAASCWDISPDGTRIAFQHDPAPVKVPGNRLAIAELALKTRRVRALADDARWEFAAPCYSPDGQSLALCAAETGRSHKALYELAVVEGMNSTGKPRWRVLTDRSWEHDVDAPLRWAEGGRALLFAAEELGRRHLWRHELASATTTALHEGGWVQGFALAGDTLVLATDAATHPVRLFARSLAAGSTTRRLEKFNDALLARRTLGEVKEVSITGALGEPVQLWLTFPVGFDSKRKHPVMHVIHGGPYAASGDSFGYRWNPHALASRGHVVVQVNYHGSSGFGFAFRDSIMGRQGELELQDIEAATDWLRRQPWADRERISATGGSYGGFLVAWMNGHVKQPGRYRSYVCHAGVFDRFATFAADSYMERPKDLHARYWEDPDRVLAQSPHSAAASFQTPTLVIHGALDYRVPDCNGLAYYNTLKARGIDARLLWFPDENHWVLKPRNSKLWYREFLDWVCAHDRPAGKSHR
jgi:dipeptidyl aminopeptidase/acylaminoacyl peptidase